MANPVEPPPEKPVGAEEPGTARAQTPQDRQLVPQGDELQFQRGSATKTEAEQGNESGENRDHVDDAMAAAR